MMNNNEVLLLNAAAAEAGLSVSDVRSYTVDAQAGLYRVSFLGDWMRYDCFLDDGGQVLGFDAEPVLAA